MYLLTQIVSHKLGVLKLEFTPGFPGGCDNTDRRVSDSVGWEEAQGLVFPTGSQVYCCCWSRCRTLRTAAPGEGVFSITSRLPLPQPQYLLASLVFVFFVGFCLFAVSRD